VAVGLNAVVIQPQRMQVKAVYGCMQEGMYPKWCSPCTAGSQNAVLRLEQRQALAPTVSKAA
jgi:hypothetical protein